MHATETIYTAMAKSLGGGEIESNLRVAFLEARAWEEKSTIPTIDRLVVNRSFDVWNCHSHSHAIHRTNRFDIVAQSRLLQARI